MREAASAELLTNGGLDDWGSSAPAGWTWTPAGTTALAQDTTGRRTGRACARIDVDGSSSFGYLWQNSTKITKQPGTYEVRGWYKTTGGGTARLYINESGAGSVYWAAAGYWAGAGAVAAELVAAADWTFFRVRFFKHWGYTAYNVVLGPNAAASCSLYFDDISLVEIRGGNLATDPGFEDWQDATTPRQWTRTIGGTSTLNKETSSQHGGAACLRADVDGTNSLAQAHQTHAVKPSTWYRAVFLYKTAAAGKSVTAFCRLTIGAASYYLQDDGTWQPYGGSYDYDYAGALDAQAWARHDRIFKTPAAADNLNMLWGFFNKSCAGSSFYIDDAWLEELGPASYADLIAQPSAQRDFLLTAEPKERLRGWAKTGGYTYTYNIAWPALYPVAFGDYFGERLANPKLENWNSPTDLVSWVEEIYGAATVEREGTIVAEGLYSAKLTNGAGGDVASIYQVGVVTLPGKLYRIKGKYRTSAGATARAALYAWGGAAWVDSLIGTAPAGRWAGTPWQAITLPEASDWTPFFIDFEGKAPATTCLFGVGVNGAGAVGYFDDLSIEGLPDAYDHRKIYRDLTRILENGTAYTERASIALVDANAGSYYFDEASGQLYVRCSDSGAADRALIWIVPYFKVHFSSGLGRDGKPKIFSGIYFEPIFDAAALPAIENEQTDFLAGGGMSFGDLEIQLANPVRFFDRLWTAWSWKNAEVALWHGGEDLDLAAYELIYSGKILEESWLGQAVKFSTANYLELLKRTVPVNPCFGEAVLDEDRGKPIPLLIGEVSGIKPLCTNASPANGRQYTIADPAFQTLKEIVAVYDDGAPVAAGSYTVDLTNCRFTFSSYTPTGEVTVWAKGAKLSDIPGESSAELLENPADAVRFFLKRILGLADASLNAASFTAAKAALADLPLCKYVRFRRNLATYLAEVERSTLSVIYQDGDGKIGMAAFDPFFVPADAVTNEEIASFKQTSPSAKLYAGVKVFYNPKPYDRPESGGLEGEDDAFDVVEGTNSGARFLDGQTTAYRRIPSWLRTQAAAAVLRDRILFLTNRAPIELELDVAGGKLLQRRPGEILAISKTKAPDPSGSLEAQTFQILTIEKHLAENRVGLKLDNLNGTAYLVGMWCADAAPAWSAASEQQRLEQGFWTDDDGLVVPGDWATADKSVWW
jgi:hypothetical protein